MRVYVPTTGDRLKLAHDWTFTLYNDHDNWYFLDAMNLPHVRMQQCTLPAGKVLRVVRFDVHGDRCHCDRVIFCIRGMKEEFWAKLSDIKVIECDFLKPAHKPLDADGDWEDHDWYESQYDWDEEYWDEEYWDDEEDGWDDSFQLTWTY